MRKITATHICIELLLLFSVFLILEATFLPINTFNAITSLIGIALLIVFAYSTEASAEKIGYATTAGDFFLSIGRSIFLCAVSILIVLFLEQIIFLLRGKSGLFFDPLFELGYSTEALSAIERVGIREFLLWAGIGVGISFVRALFYEGAFRGFVLYLNAEDDYKIGNRRQALYFAILATVPTAYAIIRAFTQNMAQNRSVFVAVLTILAAFLNQYLLAIRHGKLRFATGTIWVCVFSYWMFDYFNAMFKVFSDLPTPLTYYAVVYRSLAIQIVATLVTGKYLKRLWNKADEKNVQQEESQAVSSKI